MIPWIAAHYALIYTYHPRFDLIPVQQAWTLATEIAFYAMLPLYAAFMARRHGTPRTMLRHEFAGLATLFGLGLVSRTIVLFGIDHGGWRGFANLWLPARLDHFAFGMALAVASVWYREQSHEPAWARSRAFPWVSWGASIATFWYLSVGLALNHRFDRDGDGVPELVLGRPVDFSRAQEWWLLLLWGVVGVTAVAPAVFGRQDQGIIRAALRWGPVAWLGVISYGIYLWHEAALDFYLRTWDRVAFGAPTNQTFFFMFVFTIPVAALSYYLVERPALALKNRPVGDWFRTAPRTA